MKEKLALVIAALVISAMGVLSPATTPIVTATAPTVTLTPTSVRDNAYVLFTLTVTNPSDSTENIENILLVDKTLSVSSYFIGGLVGNENVIENIENMADNLIQAGNDMGQVADNLEEAVVNIKAAGDALIAAANYLENAAEKLKAADNENARAAGRDLLYVKDDLLDAGLALKTEPENFTKVRAKLHAAAHNLWLAAQDLNETVNTALTNAYENLNLAAFGLDNHAAENFEGTCLDNAAINFKTVDNIAGYFENAGWAMSLAHTEVRIREAGDYLDNYVAEKLEQMADNLIMAGDNLNEAGTALATIYGYLNNADSLLMRTTRCGISTAVENAYLQAGFLTGIFSAADNLAEPDNENILTVGQALENAAAAQTSDVWFGPALASNIIGYNNELVTNTVRYWIGVAGDNMNDNDRINLTTAASAFDNAGLRLVAAGNKLNETKAELTPTKGWGAETVTNGLLLVSMNDDNEIPAGASKTFTFLWRAPDIDTRRDHAITVWTLDSDNDALSADNFTITVDGQAPGLTVTVTQSGVVDYQGNAVDNLIGQVLDNGKATLTITATEALSALGTISIENYETGNENIELSMSDLTTTDNTVFTYDFYTTNWADNAKNARVVIDGPCATDTNELENENTAYCYFEVDMLSPVFIENGLSQFINLTVMTKLGTDNEYHTSIVKSWTIKGRSEDNDNLGTGGSADNDLWAITTVYVNDIAQTMIRLSDDNFSATVDLVEGINRIRVVTVDRVGLQIENKLENVFIDNTKPIVEFVSVSGRTWTDNTLRINDNTPTIRLKIYDPGFAGCTGMGIPRDNVRVVLDNDDNLANGTEIENLENYGVWDNGAATGDYNFENTYDNSVNGVVKGLATGWWYIHVQVSDNLHDNDNIPPVQRFYVDVTAPTAPATANMSSTLTAGTLASPTTTNLSSVTITGTGVADDTLKVYTTTDGVTWTEQTTYETTVNTAGEWSVAISLTSGVNTGIAFTLVDSAQNESTRTTWGYMLSDASAPTVTITSPATGTSTDQTSIVVSGTVDKDNWEEYTDLDSTVQVGSASAGGLTIGSDGSFTVSAALSEGTNTITISVTDGAGNTSSAVVSVTRTVTPWATYAIIIVVVALILAAIAIFRKR